MSDFFGSYPFSPNTKLAELVERVQKQDVESLFSHINAILQKPSLDLPHPLHDDIITTCYSSIEIRFGNVLCFADSKKAHRWYWIQTCSLIDGVVVDGECYQLHGNSFGDNAVANIAYDLINRFDTDELFSEAKHFAGLIVSHARPAHFYYDQLVSLPHLNIPSDKSIITTDKCFLNPDRLGFKSRPVSPDEWAIRPQTIPANYAFAEAMESTIRDWAQQNAEAYREDALVLWLGVADEKRCWLQQVSGYAELLNKLSEYKPVVALVDGYTAYDGLTMSVSSETRLLGELKSATTGAVEFITMIGVDYETKLRLGANADFFVTYIGTQSIVPLRLLRLPGVLHSNAVYGASLNLDTFNGVSRVPLASVVNEVPDAALKGDYLSYHMGWQSIYNLLASHMSELAGGLLSVPKLDDVVKLAGDIPSMKPFDLLGNKVASFKQAPDILREVALTFEAEGDITTALAVMSKALELRPTGIVLQRKVDQYLKQLKMPSRKEK